MCVGEGVWVRVCGYGHVGGCWCVGEGVWVWVCGWMCFGIGTQNESVCVFVCLCVGVCGLVCGWVCLCEREAFVYSWTKQGLSLVSVKKGLLLAGSRLFLLLNSCSYHSD